MLRGMTALEEILATIRQLALPDRLRLIERAAIEAAEGLQQNLQSLSHNQSGAIDQLERSIMWIDALLNAIETSKRGVKQ